MRSTLFNKETLGSFLRVNAWAIAYYIINVFSLTYFVNEEGVAIAWPPVGIFISAILLSKPKERPFIIGLLFMADFFADMHYSISISSKIFYAFTSTGDAVLSSWILLRFISNPFRLNKSTKLLKYLLLSVVLCNGVFSVIVGAYTSTISDSSFLSNFFYSWVADGVGNLLIVPFLTAWSTLSKSDFNEMKMKRYLELAALMATLFTLNILSYPYYKNGLLFTFFINYLTFPFIIWAILRFDMKIVTLVLLMLVSVMVFNLRVNNDAFVHSAHTNFTFFQLYIASIVVISLLITAMKAERNQANLDLVEAERKLLINTAFIEEKERNRYSRELHDGLGPLLSTVKMYVQSLFYTTDLERIKLIALKSNENVKAAIRTMREIAHGISPFNLSQYGYVGALLDFIDGINKIEQLSIRFNYNSNTRYDNLSEIILYRITTEMITNTMKHANASEVTIDYSFSEDNGIVNLSYRDNGKGFDMQRIDKTEGGMGLDNIQQRVKMLRGRITMNSAVGQGTTFLIEFPVN
ncbi:MAG TPA: MASE1 domain-containing protein [Bacteroidales bacterium]|nr:MASE1 domain-containing protein [Bacteroidales bacterium]